VVQRKSALCKTVMMMVLAAHIIETEQFSRNKRDEKLRASRLRQLILLGLAVAMALATLAPVVVLAA
jgi:hypothetical protein